MKKKYLIANWKMHKTVQEATHFMEALLPQLAGLDGRELVLGIAPSFVHLPAIAALIDKQKIISPLPSAICDKQFLGEAQSSTAEYSDVFEERRQASTPKLPSEIVSRESATQLLLMAQNCHHEAAGAFTGEVAAGMLASIGVGGVLIGHSERRSYQKEDNLLVAKKIKRVLENGMQPFLCCGESLEARKSGSHQAVVQQQLQEGLAGLTSKEMEKLAIAYEPVWAIGTGQVADLDVITEMHTFIRKTLSDQCAGEKVPILYGGSCNPQNAKAIFDCPNVAGGLIGSASLEVDQFMKIVRTLLE